MNEPHLDPTTGRPSYHLEQLPDGTVRQESPLTGTVVWTVPGRSHRPLPAAVALPQPLRPEEVDTRCAFCSGRHLDTPPEKARLVLDPVPARTGDPGVLDPARTEPWRILRHLPADQLEATVAEARRFPNLFEILPFEYWHANHGYELPDTIRARARAYSESPEGRAHLVAIMRTRARASGIPAVQVAALPDGDLVEQAVRLFGSTHDVVVARRHFVDGATQDDELASAGDLTPLEHHAFMALTVDALHDLAVSMPDAAYVSTFQNWLRAAGASFDHLHKQLVAIDEYGPLMARIVDMLRMTPDLFTVAIVDPAARDRLVVAENDHAVALAGVGHRYPTVEIYSTAAANRPWEHSPAALRGMSDMVHACHAATGRLVPTNEEWHYRPVGADVAMPWRINLKWRISTLAGFEGGTKINVNTIAPAGLRERMVTALLGLRDEGRIAPLSVGDECTHRSGGLDYLHG